jgi:hypothetical protein
MPGNPHSRTHFAAFASVERGGFKTISAAVAVATAFVQVPPSTP